VQKLNGKNLSNVHFKWSSKNKHVMEIEENEEFEITIPDSSTMQISRDSKLGDLKSINSELFDGAVGPIFVKGAKPGDVLEVHLKKIQVADWGWTAIMDNFGLLKNKFHETLMLWDIKDGNATSLSTVLKNISIPTNPFLGIVGTAPKKGEFGMIPPQSFGGNMDNKFINENSELLLPVNVDGALLSFSDPHAAQGDGEICGTAIETSATVIASVRILKDYDILSPIVKSSINETGKQIVTTGISNDILQASEDAAMNMIKYLRKYKLSGEESYILCSVAGNLHISEIVDEPNYVVSMALPEKILANYQL
jgi:acetamidase/formamidase